MTQAIPIRIELGPALHGLGPQHPGLTSGVRDDVTVLLGEVGLPGEPVVEVVETELRRALRLHVNGGVRRYSEGMLWRAWVEASAEMPVLDPHDVRDGWVTRQGTDDFATVAATAARHLVRDLVRLRPGCLVGVEQAVAYACQSGASVDLPGPEALAFVVSGLLDSGVSLAKRDVIVDTLVVGQRAGRTIDDILEGMLRRLRSDVVELHVNASFARELLGGEELAAPRSALDPTLPEEARAPLEHVCDVIERRPGIPSPDPVWVPSERIPPGSVALKVNDALGPPVCIPSADDVFVDATPDQLLGLGLEADGPFLLMEQPVARLPRSACESLDRMSVRYWTGCETVARMLAAEASIRSDRLFTIAEAEQQLAQLSKYYPELVNDTTARFRLPDLTRILRSLLASGASIGNLRAILQRLVLFDERVVPVPADWIVLEDMLQDLPPEPGELGGDGWHRMVAYARLGLGDDILEGLVAPGRPVVALPLEGLAVRAADLDGQDAVLDAVHATLRDPRLRHADPVVVTDLAERPYVEALVRSELPELGVLAWQELPASRAVIDLSQEEGTLIALENVTRSRVEEMLGGLFGGVSVDDDGDFVVVYGSGTIYVRVTRDEHLVFITLFAFTNTDVPPSTELFRWVAMGAETARFGQVRLLESHGSENLRVVVAHELLGNFLDSDELTMALASVSSIAQQSAQVVEERFGGRRLGSPANSTAPELAEP